MSSETKDNLESPEGSSKVNSRAKSVLTSASHRTTAANMSGFGLGQGMSGSLKDEDIQRIISIQKKRYEVYCVRFFSLFFLPYLSYLHSSTCSSPPLPSLSCLVPISTTSILSFVLSPPPSSLFHNPPTSILSLLYLSHLHPLSSIPLPPPSSLFHNPPTSILSLLYLSHLHPLSSIPLLPPSSLFHNCPKITSNSL